MYIEFSVCNLPAGDFCLGILSEEGYDPEMDSDFYQICIGLLFFTISIGYPKTK